MKTLGAAEHQQSATSFADELFDQRQLVSVEEFRFNIVQDQRIEPKQVLRIFWKTGSQFVSVFRVQPDDHGLIILFRFFVSLALEASKQRVARLPVSTTEIELRFAFGYSNHPDQVDLIVFLD